MKPYYQDETATIYCGDNREVLPLLPPASVGMVFTSPPYNLGNTTGGGFPNKRKGGHYSPTATFGQRGGKGKWWNAQLAYGYGTHDDNMPHPEYVMWQKAVLAECWRLLTPAGAIYYNHKPRILDGILVTPFEYIPDLPIRQVVIWSRGGGINYSPTFYCPASEWVVIAAKEDFRLRDKSASGIGDVWRIAPEQGNDHPAPFPLELPKRAIETTTAEVILDPFMGSGTTGVACAIQGRKFIGIELEEKYCEQAVARIRRAKLEAEGMLRFDAPAPSLLNTEEAA